MRMRTVLKELGVTRKHVIDWCRQDIPYIFHKRSYVPITEWKPKFEDSKAIEIELCELRFKDLLLHYLSHHNFKVTGRFASDLKGW